MRKDEKWRKKIVLFASCDARKVKERRTMPPRQTKTAASVEVEPSAPKQRGRAAPVAPTARPGRPKKVEAEAEVSPPTKKARSTKEAIAEAQPLAKKPRGTKKADAEAEPPAKRTRVSKTEDAEDKASAKKKSFTVAESSLGLSGGRYNSLNAEAAAKKAGRQLYIKHAKTVLTPYLAGPLSSIDAKYGTDLSKLSDEQLAERRAAVKKAKIAAEEAAGDSLAKSIDFVIRDHESNRTMKRFEISRSRKADDSDEKIKVQRMGNEIEYEFDYHLTKLGPLSDKEILRIENDRAEGRRARRAERRSAAEPVSEPVPEPARRGRAASPANAGSPSRGASPSRAASPAAPPPAKAPRAKKPA